MNQTVKTKSLAKPASLFEAEVEEEIGSSSLDLSRFISINLKTQPSFVTSPLPPSKGELKVGDLVRVRLELRADRDYEYVHLKDMRASGFEPVSTLSGHRFQDGLWYYESIKDASTNFFITYLRKGTYVFEYNLRVTITELEK